MSSMEAIQRVVAPTLQVEIPMASASASTPNTSKGEECFQVDLDTAVVIYTNSLHPKAARIMLEAMVATWEVHRLLEIVPTTLRVPDYSEKHVT
jgi:hypothetical protein